MYILMNFGQIRNQCKLYTAKCKWARMQSLAVSEISGAQKQKIKLECQKSYFLVYYLVPQVRKHFLTGVAKYSISFDKDLFFCGKKRRN